MRIEEEIEQKEFKNPYQKLHINLVYTVNWIRDQNKQVFKDFGVTLQQYNVLRILRGVYPQVKSAGEIKQVMLDKSPDLTRLLDRLVFKKLVEREICAGNRRKMDIKITEEGLKLLSEMDNVISKADSALFNLTEKEAEYMSDLLDKIRS